MMVVVDASFLATAFVNRGSSGRWARGVLLEGRLAAPELVLAEASNVIRRLELSGQLRQFTAAAVSRELMRLEIDLFPYKPFAARIWDLRHNLSVYDGWYVALAEALACPLATLDKRLAAATGPRCEFIAIEGP